MPCGQKNNTSEMIHSHTVTPPLAAMEGTTLRLKTATTKSKTRSHRPSTRRRCGASCAIGAGIAMVASFAKFVLSVDSLPRIAANRDGPLFIPPIGLSEHAAIDHAEPVVAPEIDIDLGPIAIVLDFLRIKHQC